MISALPCIKAVCTDTVVIGPEVPVRFNVLRVSCFEYLLRLSAAHIVQVTKRRTCLIINHIIMGHGVIIQCMKAWVETNGLSRFKQHVSGSKAQVPKIYGWAAWLIELAVILKAP